MSDRVGATCDGMTWLYETDFDERSDGGASAAHRRMRRKLAESIIDMVPQGRWCIVRTCIEVEPVVPGQWSLRDRPPWFRTIRGRIEFGEVHESHYHLAFHDGVCIAPPPTRPWWRRVVRRCLSPLRTYDRLK